MHIFPAALLLLLSTAYAAITGGRSDRTVSPALFADLEEAARLADIAYCVGISGIWKPFGCLSRCGDFEGFELVDVCYPPPPLLQLPGPTRERLLRQQMEHRLINDGWM
jgi:hypothetical protein